MTTPPAPTVEGVPVTWERRRALFTVDQRVAYLNHGGFGAVPVPVQRAQQRLRDELEANPMAFFTRGLLDRIAHTRTFVATAVGADPASVALAANATAAANAVLRSIELAAGDEIVLTNHGYGALRLAAEEVAARAGATVQVVDVPLGGDDDEIVTRVVGAVRPDRTRLVVVDQIASPTAVLFPVQRLVAELGRHEVPLLVDGAHAPGMLDSPAAVGADFWVGNLHKWAFTARPTALLAVSSRHRARLRPLVVSWQQDQGFPRAQEFAGTLDYTAWLAAPTGLHLLRTLGPERVRSHNNELVAHAQRAVAAAVATRWPAVLEPGERGRAELLERARAGLLGSDRVSMRLVPLPPGVADTPDAATALQARLATEYRVEVGLTAWNGWGLLRLSAQLYNKIDDYHRLVDALRDLLR